MVNCELGEGLPVDGQFSAAGSEPDAEPNVGDVVLDKELLETVCSHPRHIGHRDILRAEHRKPAAPVSAAWKCNGPFPALLRYRR